MATITHKPDASSHIQEFAYDSATGVASVTFKHDRLKEAVTVRHRLPADVFESWVKWSKAGHSVGSFFHRFVKRYPVVPEVSNGVNG